MSDDYLFDKSGRPDPDVEKLEKLLAPLAHNALLDEVRLRRKKRPPWIVLGVAVAAAAAVVIYVVRPRDPSACGGGEGFAFIGVGGEVSCGGAKVARGVLPVGGQLDTGENEASLTIANIGTAKLGKQTRVRLDRTDPQRHQLALDRGHMHAKVIAPPRLFAVTTKHTEVVDLGCEYTIDVDDHGAGAICVLTGIVELATKSGADVVAPEGSCAAILAGQRPGLPYARSAQPDVIAAVQAYDRGERGALDRLLAIAERRDAITLIALAAMDPRGKAVLERLMELSPPPDAEISVDSALENRDHFSIWRNDILEIYYGMWGPRAGKQEP
jgi:ferric-dicitrate binding protein FerR (iron transport regulator)